ncbi:MAG: dockerin type I repeat-containing protein [Armatimonadota bacterium]
MNITKLAMYLSAMICVAPLYAQTTWTRADVGEDRIFDVICARTDATKSLYVARKSAGVVSTEYIGNVWTNTVIDNINRYISLAPGTSSSELYGLRTDGYLYRMLKGTSWTSSRVDSSKAYSSLMPGKFNDGFIGMVGKNGGLYSYGYVNISPVTRVLYEGATFRGAYAAGDRILACASTGGLVLFRAATNWQPEVITTSGSYQTALIDSGDPNTIYALGTDSKLSIVRNGASGWQASVMDPDTLYYSITISPVEPGLVYASAKSGAIFCWWQQEGIWGATSISQGKYGQLATDWYGTGLVYAVPSIGAKLQGTLVFNQFAFKNPERVPMMISLRNNQGTEVGNFQVDVDNTGAYSIDTNAYGSHTLYVKGLHFLGKKSPSVFIPDTGTANVATLSLANGDTNADGGVNLFDYVVLDEHFNTPWQMADVDGDGSVNLFDYVILDMYFGAQADK